MKNQKTNYLKDLQCYQEQIKNQYRLSQIINKSYLGHSDISLNVQVDQIKQWILSDNTKPLLITATQYGGKKTLICQFIKNIQKFKNFFVISQFASVSPYYSQILYKITMQLRVCLNINQKVQLNQEKLRQYFSYWLEVADDRIQRDFLGYQKNQKMQIIIIIQGIDKVVDNKNQQVSPTFWLPNINLKNIKIIFTCQSGANTIDCLVPILSQKIQYAISNNKIMSVKEQLFKVNPKLKSFDVSTHFGDLKIASKILSSHPKLEFTQTNINFYDFFVKFVKYASLSIDSVENVCKMLGCMIWSKKGISHNTLRRALKLSAEATQKFLIYFKDVIISNSESNLIINKKMRQYIAKIINQKFFQQIHIKKQIHIAIAKALKKENNNTVNTLQQMIHHFSSSGNYTELKELLSRVENFLVLYTPLTKHLLCICWFQLQIQFQYDPVFQYNKAIQRFLNHYYPSAEDTFKIIFQLSLFFKEYSEFENSKTPKFRHPPIRGQISHMKQISIYDQLVQMNMFKKCKLKNKEGLAESIIKVKKFKQQNSDKNKNCNKKSMNKIQFQEENNKQKCGRILQENQQMIWKQLKQGKQVEKLNIRIKFHQQKFKSLYFQEMEPYINQFYLLKKKSLMQSKNQLLDQDSDGSQDQLDQTKIDLEKIKRSLFLKRFNDYCEEQYHIHSQKRSFYYYKQWIWMQFPWICQSLNSNYSELIQKCMKSPTQYMSIEIQSKLISEAVKIAKIGKENKKQIYENSLNTKNNSLKLKNDFQQQKGKIQKLAARIKAQHKTENLKQKFEISKLDLQFRKNALPKKPTKSQSSVFTTGIQISQCYQDQKQNNINQTTRLPCILKNSSLDSNKISNNFQIIDSRQYGLLIAKYDQIKHENQQLVQKIKIIQQNRDSMKQNNKDLLKQITKLETEEFKQKKLKIIKDYKTQQALREKLEMIIKLCDLNKSHGSESADLSGFLNSLKTMYKIQEQNLQNISLNLNKILEQSKNQYRKIRQQQANLVLKLKKQKSKFSKNTQLIQINQIQKVIPKQKSHNRRAKNATNKQQHKKRSKIIKQIQNINSQLKMLSQQFGLINGQYQKNQQILANFEDKLDKLHEIQWKLKELIDQNTLKQLKLSELQEKIHINKGNREHQKQVIQKKMQSLNHQNIQKTDQRIKYLLKCFSLIEQTKNTQNSNYFRIK